MRRRPPRCVQMTVWMRSAAFDCNGAGFVAANRLPVVDCEAVPDFDCVREVDAVFVDVALSFAFIPLKLHCNSGAQNVYTQPRRESVAAREVVGIASGSRRHRARQTPNCTNAIFFFTKPDNT